MKNGALAIEPVDAAPIDPCPKCSVGVVTRRTGRHGDFESCSTWPRCDFKRNIANDERTQGASPIRLTGSVAQGSTCPSCNRGRMVRIDGKYGEFLGCSEFPICKTTASMG
ncbi:topoisomerase DNA-binding C4 zinc finger domain-containing protein [Sphingobium indicum]|uniref:topoisomerase DNA-binding C4 zinc finger domain-containing protein n=1 Tax=Sphingobium indicum TaxID=332055 RepID=UPI0012FF2AE2